MLCSVKSNWLAIRFLHKLSDVLRNVTFCRFTVSQRNRFGDEGRISLRNTEFFTECPLRADSIRCPPFSTLYRTGDGSCNNLKHPEWGASFRPFQRFLPAEYGDGVESFRQSVLGGPLPSARTVSALVHRHRNISTHQFTTMVMQWGQFLDHDITCKFNN